MHNGFNSDKFIIRFIGDKYRKDLTVTNKKQNLELIEFYSLIKWSHRVNLKWYRFKIYVNKQKNNVKNKCSALNKFRTLNIESNEYEAHRGICEMILCVTKNIVGHNK